MSEWISTAERLPEDRTEALVWPRPDDSLTAEFFNGRWVYFEYEQYEGYVSVSVPPEFFTHWMPLPPPPA